MKKDEIKANCASNCIIDLLDEIEKPKRKMDKNLGEGLGFFFVCLGISLLITTCSIPSFIGVGSKEKKLENRIEKLELEIKNEQKGEKQCQLQMKKH